ncbi:BglG family transcription antiterminator [Amphibacillus sp. Q70]|uniref:BglG family transcription antiterminator n=1 Tax=Amphibacillus sp. Q70 TaxID=3453416 RepID=UPI003F856B7B
MLSKRETQILRLLYDHRYTYLTSQEIAAKLDISNKTARKYLHMLKSELERANLADITAKQNCGYQLTIQKQKPFDHFYLKTIQSQPVLKDITTIQEAKDRQYYILNRLFFEQSEVYVDRIAAELFVSRSTISNDLVEIKKLLKPFEVQLKSKSNKGLFPIGKERNIRHFIMNYFFMDRLQDNLYAFSMYASFLEGISIEEIVIIVLDECRESHLKLSDFIVYNLVLHIGLAIKRMQSGFEIELSSPMNIDINSLEYQTAKKILQRIENNMQIKFPSEEADFIAMHLRNKIASKKIFQKTDYSEAEIKEQLLTVLNEIDQRTDYYLEHDMILIDGLMMHFTPLLLRLQNQTSIENPLLDEIKSHYPDLFDLTINFFSKMPVFKAYQMTDSEWAYITIHLTAAVERFYNEQKARVLVICATGLGSSQMLKNRLERELGSKIYIEKVISYYEIADQDLSKIELIISSINVPHLSLNIPIVNVSVFLSEEDIKKINHELSAFKGIKQFQIDKKQTNEMIAKQISLIEQCFKSELFIYLETASTKKAVLNDLIHHLENAEGKALKEAFLKQLKLRESYSAVTFSDHLAVPHPIEPLTNKAYVAIAIAPKGIKWDEEHPNIQLVFLLSPDKLGQFELDRVSEMLVPIIDDDCFRRKLVNSTAFDHFVAAFIQQIEQNNLESS